MGNGIAKCFVLLALAIAKSGVCAAIDDKVLRPPAVPLVACDPYFSIWSSADRLTDDATRHWTGKTHRLTSLVRIDGKAYRVMGDEPQSIPPLKQTALAVLPTRTIYQFDGGGIRLTLTFMTAALPDDLMILSRPVTYLTWEVLSVDGKKHAVAIYYDNTAEPVVNDPNQAVIWSQERLDGVSVLRMGTRDQLVLGRKGDGVRIDWGYLYVALPETMPARQVIAAAKDCRDLFSTRGYLPSASDTHMPRAVNADAPVMAVVFYMGKVKQKTVRRWLILAYDDLYSIQYFRRNLRPYWRRGGAEARDLLKLAAKDYASLEKRCRAFDTELMSDLRKEGGENYARICALAYRQCLAANKIAADANGQPLLFPKENTSNGCIGTVDVIYPMAPQFLLLSPALSKAMLVPILDYASSERWRFPFAPHDLGTYPLANGQVYGGGERTEVNQMPVEETGNMLILMAVLAQLEGNADFAVRYWPLLQKWAEYLKAKGFDPENQLCTDDFAGHLAHNVNLSAKAIVALGAYAFLCDLRGETDSAAVYRALAHDLAARWIKEADDGDHYRLTFDKPGTWSQKYNLVWDRILGLNLFPADALRKEMAFYKKTMDRYGLPLDNRKPYAKLDWSLWTATLTGVQADFEALISPVYDFLNDTPNRVPMNDLYWTQNAREVGMHARPVVGGVFLKMLYDRALWKKWSARDRTRPAGWAPIPAPPKIIPVVPASEQNPASWRYRTESPGDRWYALEFNDSSWKEGPAGFGAGRPPGAVVRTEWKTPDIWLRREITLPEGKWTDLQFWIHHDEDVEVYVNGILAAFAAGYLTSYESLPMTPAGKAALKPGKNLIAVHCHQMTGGQYIDLGLVDVRPK
jgi:hypothetical protein